MSKGGQGKLRETNEGWKRRGKARGNERVLWTLATRTGPFQLTKLKSVFVVDSHRLRGPGCVASTESLLGQKESRVEGGRPAEFDVIAAGAAGLEGTGTCNELKQLSD